MQNGFPSHLSSQDGPIMIHEGLTTQKESKNHTQVSGGYRHHEGIRNSATQSGDPKSIQQRSTRKTYVLCHAFLKKRVYQISGGDTNDDIFYQTGVRQGLVLTPSLFNMVMRDLTFDFKKVKRLHFTIYTNDVSVSTIGGPVARQQRTLQRTLNVRHAFMLRVGIIVLPEKTAYVAISNS